MHPGFLVVPVDWVGTADCIRTGDQLVKYGTTDVHGRGHERHSGRWSGEAYSNE